MPAGTRASSASEVTSVNQRPAIINRVAGRVQSVLAFEIVDDRIRAIFIVANPDKLAHLGPAPRGVESVSNGPGHGGSKDWSEKPPEPARAPHRPASWMVFVVRGVPGATAP
jgi:hypothetical protein